MKKLLIMSIALVAIMATVFTVSAFAANTVAIDDVTGISIAEYKDAEGNVDDDYVTMTVTYTATADPAADAMSRITFMLSATTVADELEGNEAKVVYLDEQVTPNGSYSFVVEKARIQTALGLASIDLIEGQKLLFKMGGVGVDEAEAVEVVYNSPKSEEDDIMYGEVNGDSKVNYNDAIIILQADVDLLTLTTEQTKSGDINGDGKTNYNDAIVILQCDVDLLNYDEVIANRPITN